MLQKKKKVKKKKSKIDLPTLLFSSLEPETQLFFFWPLTFSTGQFEIVYYLPYKGELLNNNIGKSEKKNKKKTHKLLTLVLSFQIHMKCEDLLSLKQKSKYHVPQL